MRIIHTADIHLDSKMETNLNGEKAKQRKSEILETFKKMVSYAVQNDVAAILISGDLFDTRIVSGTVRKVIETVISDNPGIVFYYLKGNHDEDSFLAGMEKIPDNLKMFSDTWTKYKLSEGIEISGVELSSQNSNIIYDMLYLNEDMINIVMLHGQESTYNTKDKTEVIALSSLRNKGIDYLALGHVHGYKFDKLDERGMYCYPGCLEGRGFDECGEHGFVMLEIDERKKKITHRFVPFASRTLYEVEVDISDMSSSIEVEKTVEERLKIVLKGNVEMDSEINTDYLTHHFAQDYYFVKVKNETEIKVDYDSYEMDASLKGEYVRCIKNDMSLSESEKARLIKMGIDMLMGQ